MTTKLMILWLGSLSWINLGRFLVLLGSMCLWSAASLLSGSVYGGWLAVSWSPFFLFHIGYHLLLGLPPGFSYGRARSPRDTTEVCKASWGHTKLVCHHFHCVIFVQASHKTSSPLSKWEELQSHIVRDTDGEKS